MIVDDVDQRTVRSALKLAAWTPSVHNSQPRRWLLGPRSVHLYADMRRWLSATDADGRDLVVSCGVALHHLRVVLFAAGVAASVHRIPNPDEPDHLAAVELHAGAPAGADLGLASAIVRRRTDRRRFGDWEVPEVFVQELVERAADQGALLRAVTEPRARALLLAANLLRDAIATGAGTARRFSVGLIEQPDTGETDGALLLVLGTSSDDPLSQLRAGEALSSVVLHATELGLATCPLSQPLEVGATRLALRDEVLDGTMSPQLVLRVGWAPTGPPLPPTPRRPVDDTIGRLPR